MVLWTYSGARGADKDIVAVLLWPIHVARADGRRGSPYLLRCAGKCCNGPPIGEAEMVDCGFKQVRWQAHGERWALWLFWTDPEQLEILVRY